MGINIAEPSAEADLSNVSSEVLDQLIERVGAVVRGKEESIRQAVITVVGRGHLLIEDVPGVGKTTLARAMAQTLGLSFQRIQFTSDLLPSDVIGVSVYRQSSDSFEFQPGPLFANVVLADEINRASPKTQSALLEAMSEGTVSVDRKRYRLPQPFIVLATQNPVEHHGTFPLPESQLDRFATSLELGYPAAPFERDLLLSDGADRALETLAPLLDAERMVALQDAARRVHVEPKLADYMVALANETRGPGEWSLGLSTRGLLAVHRTAQARALISGRDFVTPEDVQIQFRAAVAHRLVPHDAVVEIGDRVERLIGSVPLPA